MDKQLYKNVQKVKKAAAILGLTPTVLRNSLLADIAKNLIKHQKEILAANKRDLKKINEDGPKYDRLLLNSKRIKEMAGQLKEVAKLKDVLGEIFDRRKLSNGLQVEKTRVPLGVIGIIYEARPNVTSDVAGLCFKTGNAVVLRGGHESYETNKKIVALIKSSLKKNNLPVDCLFLVDPAFKKNVKELLKMDDLIDVIIPRGGRGLIDFVRKNSTIQVIETGAGVCHTYMEKTADLKKAAKIIFNAKTQRPSTCNALDTLVVEEEVIKEFLPMAARLLKKKSVLIKADQKSYAVLKKKYPAHLLKKAMDEDFGREFLDYILSIKTVKNFEEAVKFIQAHTSGHSEAILTKNYKLGRRFFRLIEAAAVYLNTSTRFTDGHEFGLGAEIGISTQKLHCRGPLGLKELLSYKWLVKSDWQSRP